MGRIMLATSENTDEEYGGTFENNGIETLLTQLGVPTTATSYNCDWKSYKFISVEAIYNNNVRGQILVPTSYFNITNASNSVQVNDFVANSTYSVYKNTDGSIYASATNENAQRGIRIYGISSN